jgi:hypothetical protein
MSRGGRIVGAILSGFSIIIVGAIVYLVISRLKGD